ncbi:hypothetical protein UY3_07326 [Chelonia mydas]|uniref:Myb/SANT-like DNA-binding domain-containing protein n=1 Tax=Chelonia mydas TaxID=8469 RepID=M7BDY0_CHEMY|nr:hypothetical protein UY3_07326 [Chelonia mydas]
MQSSSVQVTMQSQNRKRAPAWTEREVLELITAWGEEFVQAELRSKRRNPNIFAKISKGMMDRGYNRDARQFHVEIKELRQAYQKTNEANIRSGSEPHTFYDELHAILGRAPTTTPPHSVDTCKGRVSCNRDEDFVEEEDEEDSAQQASGESLLPSSRNCSSPWSQHPPNPPKAGSQTMKPEKAPLRKRWMTTDAMRIDIYTERREDLRGGFMAPGEQDSRVAAEAVDDASMEKFAIETESIYKSRRAEWQRMTMGSSPTAPSADSSTQDTTAAMTAS